MLSTIPGKDKHVIYIFDRARRGWSSKLQTFHLKAASCMAKTGQNITGPTWTWGTNYDEECLVTGNVVANLPQCRTYQELTLPISQQCNVHSGPTTIETMVLDGHDGHTHCTLPKCRTRDWMGPGWYRSDTTPNIQLQYQNIMYSGLVSHII